MIGKIIDKKEVAQKTLQVKFEVPQPVQFKPGQYTFVNLPKLNYPDDRGEKRQFSINNSPSESSVLTITTRLSDSGFKKTLNELPVGSEVELGPIAGVFTLPEDTSRPLVLIAGGIGITPFMSMLTFIKEQSLLYKQSLKFSLRSNYKITLLYSNRNQASTAYLNELQELANILPNLKLILTMTEDNSWAGEKRQIDSFFLKEYFPNVNDNLYMVVGPPAMVEAVEKALIKAGVKDENIRTENFTGY